MKKIYLLSISLILFSCSTNYLDYRKDMIGDDPLCFETREKRYENIRKISLGYSQDKVTEIMGSDIECYEVPKKGWMSEGGKSNYHPSKKRFWGEKKKIYSPDNISSIMYGDKNCIIWWYGSIPVIFHQNKVIGFGSLFLKQIKEDSKKKIDVDVKYD